MTTGTLKATNACQNPSSQGPMIGNTLSVVPKNPNNANTILIFEICAITLFERFKNAVITPKISIAEKIPITAPSINNSLTVPAINERRERIKYVQIPTFLYVVMSVFRRLMYLNVTFWMVLLHKEVAC